MAGGAGAGAGGAGARGCWQGLTLVLVAAQPYLRNTLVSLESLNIVSVAASNFNYTRSRDSLTCLNSHS